MLGQKIGSVHDKGEVENITPKLVTSVASLYYIAQE